MGDETEKRFDRASENKAFDDTKTGVKGLVDSGITKVPRIFHAQPETFVEPQATNDPAKSDFSIPVIDLSGVAGDPVRRKEVVDLIRKACEKSGFFVVVNHGIPPEILDEMLDGTRRFYNEDDEIKKQYYTRDASKTVLYNSNFNLFTAPNASWRDTSYVNMAPIPPNPDDLPQACREILIKYTEHVMKLGRFLFELLSEGLGLEPNHLNDMGCSEGLAVLYHCYPACPEPGLTWGSADHTDSDFLTVLLQDEQAGWLQVLHENQWFDVPPVPGTLVINVGDLLQMVSNDKFKSSHHRVWANQDGPRVSVASFFTTGLAPFTKVFGPIKELVSEDDPPKFRETTVRDYSLDYDTKGLRKTSTLDYFRV